MGKLPLKSNIYLLEEEKYTIAQANSAIKKDGSFEEELVVQKNLNF